MSGLRRIGDVQGGCPNCPPRKERLNLNLNHHPGFGIVELICDGDAILSDFHGTGISYGRTAERIATANPDHDWRLRIEGPLYGVVYQRQGERDWYAVEKLEGFA